MAKQDDKGASAPTQLSDIDPAVLKLARETSELPDVKRRYIMSLVDAMLADDSGSVEENIRRHLAGERVTTQYVNMRTGESVQVPMGEPIPKGCVPMLGEVGADE